MFGDELDIKPDVKINKKPLSRNSGKQKTDFSRNMLTSDNVAQGSGGIDTSNMSTGIGNTQLATRETTKVKSSIEDLAKRAAKSTGGNSRVKSRSFEEVTIVMDRNKSRIYQYYNRALRKDPTLSGKVVFELTIDPSGRVTKVRILSSELNNPKLEAKLTSLLKRLNFGAQDVAETVIEYPVDFLPP